MSCHFEPRMNIYKFPDPCAPRCPCSCCPPIPKPICFGEGPSTQAQTTEQGYENYDGYPDQNFF